MGTLKNKVQENQQKNSNTNLSKETINKHIAIAKNLCQETPQILSSTVNATLRVRRSKGSAKMIGDVVAVRERRKKSEVKTF